MCADKMVYICNQVDVGYFTIGPPISRDTAKTWFQCMYKRGDNFETNFIADDEEVVKIRLSNSIYLKKRGLE